MIYIFNCNWVDTRWQKYSTHLHTNNTQNTDNGKYITIKKIFSLKAANYPLIITLLFSVCLNYKDSLPIPTAPRFKALVCGSLLAGKADSNPAGGMDVCLLWVLCVFRYTSLRRADHTSTGFYRVWYVWVWSQIFDNEAALTMSSHENTKKNSLRCTFKISCSLPL
jgi:hypothetical protein